MRRLPLLVTGIVVLLMGAILVLAHGFWTGLRIQQEQREQIATLEAKSTSLETQLQTVQKAQEVSSAATKTAVQNLFSYQENVDRKKGGFIYVEDAPSFSNQLRGVQLVMQYDAEANLHYLGSIQVPLAGNYHHRLLGTKLFFVDHDGGLAAFDVATGSQDKIQLPGVVPGNSIEQSLGSFVISKSGTIYYLGDQCNGSGCSLHSFDLATGSSAVLTSQSRPTVDEMSILTIRSLDESRHVLELQVSGGDAGHAGVTEWEFNLATKKWTRGESAYYETCVAQQCTKKEQDYNKRYEELTADSVSQCGQLLAQADYEAGVTMLKVKMPGSLERIRNAYFVGCL